MLTPEARPYVGVCVRAGLAAIAVLQGDDLTVRTMRLDRRARGQREQALCALVRELVPDRDRTTIVAEPGCAVLRILQGRVRGLLSLSFAQVQQRLLRSETSAAGMLLQHVVDALPELYLHARFFHRAGRVRVPARRLAYPLAAALALAGQRTAAET